MAYSPNRYTGDGATTSFAVTFEQYSWTSIQVSVNGAVIDLGYTYNTVTHSIDFINPPADGAAITIRRVTDTDLLYKFGEGAAFTGANLDINFEQYQSAVEEVQSGADQFYVDDVLAAETAARTAADASLQAQLHDVSPLLNGEVGTVLMQKRLIENSVSVPTGMNAFSVGPQIAIAPGQAVNLEGDATWAILGNAFEMDDLYNLTANTITTSDGSVSLEVTDIVVQSVLNAALALKANLASPNFTGTPTAPTATAGTNTTQLATTAFVAALGALKANLASPTFTGTPAAPTAAAGTNTTQIATTAFVAALGALKANLASPTFTGTPAAPTATAGTSTTQIATTAFVAAAITAGVVASAAKLTTARTLQVNLASTAAASFDGSANASPGVTGVLPRANGGSGQSDVSFVNAQDTTSVTLTASTFVLLAPTEITDTKNAYSAGTWTCPADGYYQLKGFVRFGNATVNPTTAVRMIKIDSASAPTAGAVPGQTVYVSSGGGDVILEVSCTLQLTTGTALALYAYHTDGANMFATHKALQIIRVA